MFIVTEDEIINLNNVTDICRNASGLYFNFINPDNWVFVRDINIETVATFLEKCNGAVLYTSRADAPTPTRDEA